MMKRSHLDLVLIAAVLLVVFAVGFGVGRLTAIAGAQRDFQLHSANGELFIFNPKTGQLWRRFFEYNYGNPSSGLQPVDYYDANASVALRQKLDAEKVKHFDLANFPDQSAKPQIDFQPVAMPTASSSIAPKAKPVQRC
jgi:hypothetical protein